jgi:hypothetical protein
MAINLSYLLRIVAVVVFILAAAGVNSRIGLVPAGLACWLLSTLI